MEAELPLKIQDSRVSSLSLSIAPPKLAWPFLKRTRRIVTTALLPVILSRLE
jgi:hypothetical protein